MFRGNTDSCIKKMLGCFFAVLLVFGFITILPANADAADYYVDIYNGNDIPSNGTSSGTGAWRTLHYALAQMTAGGTLHVANGNYSLFNGESDTPLSVPADTTIIGESDYARINGSSTSSWLMGLSISAPNVVIENLLITNFSSGSGIFIQNASPVIKRNTIYFNKIGIYIRAVSSPASSPRIENNLIYQCPYGISASISVADSNPEIYHNTIDGPAAESHINGIRIQSTASISPQISYNIISNFTGPGAAGIYYFARSGSPVLSYNDVWNNATNYSGIGAGAHDISADPSFEAYEYYPRFGSPCNDVIPWSANDPVTIDRDGNSRPLWGSSSPAVGWDIGAYEYGRDTDNDHMDDNWEISFFGSTDRDGTQDYDGDGLTDYQEYLLTTNPTLSDTDGDGLSDGAEINTYHTNPFAPDTDDDGMADGWEVQYGLNPLVNDAGADKDGDTYNNLQEFLDGTNPGNNTDYAGLAGNFFVDAASGNDAVSGRSWTYAKKTIQAVLEFINDMGGTPPFYINIKQGTYTETVQLPNGVHLRGGYSPALTGTDLSIQDVDTYPTVIDVDGDPYVISTPYTNQDGAPKAIWGSSPYDVYVALDNGDIYHHTQGTATTFTLAYSVPNYDAINGIWGSGPANIYFAGNNGTILHYDGASWAMESTGIEYPPFYGVWGSGPDDVYAVGENSTILHYDGASWSDDSPDISAAVLYGIWGSGPDDVYVVGQNGMIVHYQVEYGEGGYGYWSEMTSGVSADLRGVWGTGRNNVYAVGDGGTILHYDGESWSTETSGVSVNLRSIWGTGPNDIYAVGDGGTILHYNGSAWHSQSSPVAWDIYSITGMPFASTGGPQIAAVGGSEINPLLYSDEAGSWKVVFPPTSDIGIDSLTLQGSTSYFTAVDIRRPADHVTVSNCVITNNTNGEIVFFEDASDVSITGVTFTGNQYNGVAFEGNASHITISNNTIDGTGGQYGAIALQGGYSSGISDNIVIQNNTIENFTNTRICGIKIDVDTASASIVNNKIQNLSGSAGGGGDTGPLSSYLGIGVYGSNTNLTISGNELSNIAGFREDGIVLYGEALSSNALIEKNRISNLTTTGIGGGICFYQINDTAKPCTVANNLITNSSLGIYSGGSGVRYVFNTLYGNDTGIKEYGSYDAANTFKDNIVANSGSYGFFWASEGITPVVGNNDVYGSGTSNYEYMTDPTGSNGNISENPMFENASGGDFGLQEGSPCINAGTDAGISVDINGLSRPQGGGFDIGAYEALPYYTITASASAGGTLDPTGSISMISGSSQTFTITPDSGYAVTSVVVDGVEQGPGTSYTFANVTTNHTISVTFTAFWTITSSAGANGSINPSGSLTVNDGNSQAYTITANPGYEVASVLVDGVDQGGITSYTFANVTANHTISATFIAVWTVSAGAGANGSINPVGDITVTNGASQAYTITANPGYEVASVLVDGVDQGALTSYTFTNVTANHTISATFIAVYTITAGAGANGSINPSGISSLTSGTSQAYAITANPGYTVASVVVDGVDQGPLTTYIFSNVTAHHTISATFVAVWTITSSAGANGSITPSGSVSVTNGGSQAYTITADAGYKVASVVVDGVNQGPRTSYTFFNVTAHHTISATFVAVWTITSSAGANGSITPSGSVSVTNGDSQAYTITADTGYKVASVMVDGVDQGPLTSYTFSNVTAHHTISATFVAVWTITASSGANGSITPSGSVNVTNGAGQAYTIAGNNGYTVASVVVDGVDQGPLTSYTFSNVTANHTISATFIRLWTITSSAGANGSITPSGSVSVINGDSQPFTITPGEGHEVTSVVVDGVDQGPLTSYTFSNVTANHTISATFTALWTITASAGANGSITPSGSISVINGTSQAYTITTNAGYAVTSVMVDGIDQGPLTSYTFTNVTADHTISATFTTLWTITASAGANGSITPSGSISVINGTSQAYMITANTGYAVASVVVDGIDQGPLTSYTFANVTANHTINATFIALWTISASAGTNGSIAPVGNVSVKNGDNQVFTFTPDSGYSIKRITVDGQEVTAAGSYIFANVTGNHTIAVVFLSNKNQPPDKPSLISPIDNVLLPEGPVELKSGPFSDPDGDDHILSRWQIRRGDDKAYFYDESSNEDLTEHTVSLNLDYGMQYFWRVGYVDSGKEQITWSDEASFVIGEPAVNKEAPPVQPGVAVSAYRMVSFVQFPKHPSAKAVFGPLMGSGYDMGDYRIGIYDPAINSYHEYPDFDVVPGRAYWFLARNGMNFSVEGVPVSMTMDIYVPLLFNPVNKNGWNMIACPNKASYYWGDIEIVVKDDEGTIIYGPMPVRNLTADNGYIDKRIWVWKNGAYSVGSETLKMTPYNGYWVKAKAAGVSLVFPSGMQVALRNPDVMISGLVQSGSEWLHQKISPANAFADYDADSPPMPMPGLQSSASGTTGGSSGGGCFIFTIDGAKDQ